MNEIIYIRSRQGLCKELKKDDVIIKNISTINAKAIALGGQILSDEFVFETNKSLDKFLNYIKLLKTDSFCVTAMKEEYRLEIFENTAPVKEKWHIILDIAKNLGATYNFCCLDFCTPEMGLIFIDKIKRFLE